MPESLSSRGERAAATPLRIDYDAFRETEEDRYHATANPNGKIPLNIAENRLSWAELRPELEAIGRAHSIPDWVAAYTVHRGSPEFREALAHFLETHLTKCPVDADQLAVSPGATGVVEMTAFVLAEAGDVAVIPAPCYPVYSHDLGNFAAVERYDLVTHREPAEIADGPILSIDHLERARADIDASGRRFRMLVLTSPDNPTGGVYPIDRLREIARWCIGHGIHLVVNEIYGLSILDTSHPDIRDDYRTDLRFTSFGHVMHEEKSEYLHLWYALSKDLGLSGLRVGAFWSMNARAIEAYGNLNLTHSISNHTQWLLSHLLTNDAFMMGFIEANQERLTASYALAARSFREMGVPYVPSRGSLFLWVDLSEFLLERSKGGELGLWREIFHETGVLLTPGVGFGHTKHGQFRVVVPCVEPEELEVAMTRLARFVEAKRTARDTR